MSDSGIGRLYTKDFKDIRKSDKIALVVSVISLILGLIGLFLGWKQNGISEAKVQRCNEIAIGLEKARHYPVDDLQVTNQDISSYMRNMASCLAD